MIRELIILSTLFLAVGCVSAKPPPASQAPPAGAKASPTTAPAAADSARIVVPIKVRKEGRYRISTYQLKPGEGFQTARGGIIKVGAVSADEISLDRTYPGWKIAARPMKHSIGNWEYIRIISVDSHAGSVKLELKT